MATIHVAYTAPLNPSGASPVLSRARVWKGLQRKVHRAQDFLPVIEACRVVEETEGGSVVVREATFKKADEGAGVPEAQRGKVVKEVCRLFEPVKVDFHQPNGAVITNCISDGPSMEETDLNMTYIFEWRHEDLQAGSKEFEDMVEEHRRGAKTAVDKSIKAIRRMANAGEL